MRIAKTTSLAGILIVVVILLSTRGPAFAQSETPLSYDEMPNVYIRGDFLRYWQSVPDALLLFGFPITNEYTDPITNRLTQYFQRARFELLMVDGRPVVQLANLGWMLYEPFEGTPANVPETPAMCRYFSQKGISVCYAFWQFYEAHQGEKYFGLPVSGLEFHNGTMVQYFDRAIMEWQPNRPSGQRVALSFVGQRAFNKFVADPTWINRSPDYLPGSNAPGRFPITGLKANAFVKHSLLKANATQTLYLVAEDQNQLPVQGAQASVKVIYPDGSSFPIRILETTNTNGILTLSFPVGALPTNEIVRLEVSLEYMSFKSTTTSWFRIWN